MGDRVRQFETALSAFWGREETVGVASGLDAIEIALRAAGLSGGALIKSSMLYALPT